MDVGAIATYRPTKPELAVFVSGVASMGLEILAGRIVAPQFGSSIYTWGSIITVFLAALSLGYWQGGKRADRASNRALTWFLLATATYVAVLIYAYTLLLVYTSTIPLPPRYASLPAIIILFGPPTYLLGFISPYAAELSRKDGVGAASGHVYALGTIGSILGAGATTFVLIPALSITQIGLLFGFILVATAGVLTLPRPTRTPIAGIVLVTVLLLVAAGASPVAFDHRGEVVYETQTAYQQLEVIDDGTERTMYLDGARHSAMDLDDPERHVFAYTRYFHLGMLLAEDPDAVERVLFVGGGGYTGPTDFEKRYDVTVDVVEIDPAVTDAAETYFDLEESDSLTVHTGDGRQYLTETAETYDVIVLDAYKRDQVPFELTTVEFMTLVQDRLADDGTLVANVVSAPSGTGSEFYRAQYATIDAVFPAAYSFRTSDSTAVQNVQIVATAHDRSFTQDDLETRDEQFEPIDLESELDGYMAPPKTDDVPVLRDDRAPVEDLLDPMLGQRYVIEGGERNGTVESVPAIDRKSMAPTVVETDLDGSVDRSGDPNRVGSSVVG